MRATEDIKHEHRVVEVVLPVLDRMADGLERGNALSREHLENALEFLRVFVDKCHHGKEERHLFGMLESRGVSRQVGLLSELLREHGQGRAHVRALMQSYPTAIDGDPAAGRTFAEHARGYTNLLRMHIGKEDTKLVLLADQTLSAEDDAELVEQFERLERDEIGEGAHEKYHRMAHELARAVG